MRRKPFCVRGQLTYSIVEMGFKPLMGDLVVNVSRIHQCNKHIDVEECRN